METTDLHFDHPKTQPDEKQPPTFLRDPWTRQSTPNDK